ncbi:hypothetical protein QBC34DRAFT_433511 [Podospora aff. communis PSN243]|uniref:DUF7726 domain-containing protein n=1 Tax=Podospora aff. communis PSN243 TaxID=3040156 RepID=A0AAV9H1D9_9PEZI|nr:hypothetical protein QBC34DRAFT_433511 [Podospora aff. communis PSN243]
MNPNPSSRAPLGALPTTTNRTALPSGSTTAMPLTTILNWKPNPANNENAPLPTLPYSKGPVVLAPISATAQPQKRKSLDQEPAALDINVEDLPIDQNCDQVRRKINRFLDSGEMTKTAFANEIGVSMKSLNNFLSEHGAYKGSGSSSYDLAWAFFKERELRGVAMPKKKVAKTTAASAASGTAAAAAAATPAAKGAFAFGNSSGLDLSTVVLEGEDTDSVPVFDSCDEIRRKINAHMKNPNVTQAQFCRDILAQLHSPAKPKSIQGSQLQRFRGMKGADAGAGSLVFYGAYVFFEKIRIKEGKSKTKHRLAMEETWPEGFEREGRRGGYWCLGNERPVMDKLGKVSFY